MTVSDLAGSVTLSQVADHAGVSLATASRALNGSTRKVKPELHQRVLASAAALGYSANVLAQSVARGASKTVAIVLGDIADPYFSAIASGVIRVAEANGLVVTMAATGGDADREDATLVAIKGQRPQAVILAGSRHIDEESGQRMAREVAAIERLGGRVSVIGSRTTTGRAVAVLNRAGAAALADALIDLGYRNFAIIAGNPDLVTAAERSTGFVEAAAARGIVIAPDRVIPSKFSRDGGFESVSALLASGARPDCVFAVADVVAVGAMAAIRVAGLVPGHDIGVAGFDDIQMLQDVTPSLTTVALPLAEIGARSLELALADNPDASLTAPIEGRVVVRDSTPPRRAD
jgi:LacI family transcriptional regulator